MSAYWSSSSSSSCSSSSTFSSFLLRPCDCIVACQDLNRDPVTSVCRAGPQPRSCDISVPRRTSNAILWHQCSAPDLSRDPVTSVCRAGPQPRSCEIDQCSAPDLNRDSVTSVCRAGPQRASSCCKGRECSPSMLRQDALQTAEMGKSGSNS